MELTMKTVEVAAICLVLTALLGLKLRTIGSRDKDLPPGPKTTPVLGNALDFPTSFPYLKFSEWSRRYGDVFSLKIFNQTFIVVTSAKAVKHILDNQGLYTGNRPRSVLLQRVINGSFMSLENMESPVWKNSRKAIHTFFEGSLERHLQTQQIEYSHFMLDSLEDPKNFFQHICRTTASVMITLLYGSRITKYEGSPAQTYFRAVKLINEVTDPAAHPPVDFFWPLQYVPKRWAYWKRLADTTRGIRDELYGSLYEQCERAIEENKQTGCYLEELILNREKLGMTREDIIGMGAVMMEAGAETTASFLQSFVLALINNPHVQERGQQEIDSVVQPDRRWPTLDDYERVPYIRAIADEVHRYRTILPIAIPHVSTKEIQYRSYRIPKDSIILMNTYGIFHDPEMYDDPEIFEPERYVRMNFGTKEGVDTKGYRNNFAFGSGRRACPGESMARRTIALNTMNLLWAFNFKKDGSATGGQDLDSYAKPGLELAPNPFTCDISPRSAIKAQMIRDRYAKAFPARKDGAIMN